MYFRDLLNKENANDVSFFAKAIVEMINNILDMKINWNEENLSIKTIWYPLEVWYYWVKQELVAVQQNLNVENNA